jgi:hypothetical protein
MLKIQPYYPKVIHFEFDPDVAGEQRKEEFDFKEEPYVDSITGKTVKVMFRLTTRIEYDSKTKLSYVAEHSFGFIPNADELDYGLLDRIIKQAYQKYLNEFVDRIRPNLPFELPVQYLPRKTVEDILQRLKP